jgi:hypothetical protein
VLRKSQYKSRRRTEVFFAADDGKRFVVRVNEKLAVFVELESAILACRELA